LDADVSPVSGAGQSTEAIPKEGLGPSKVSGTGPTKQVVSFVYPVQINHVERRNWLCPCLEEITITITFYTAVVTATHCPSVTLPLVFRERAAARHEPRRAATPRAEAPPRPHRCGTRSRAAAEPRAPRCTPPASCRIRCRCAGAMPLSIIAGYENYMAHLSASGERP
jgi:hypothetical protein